MGQSLVQNYIHLVFSTKHRQRLITPDIEDKLHAYLGGICKGLGCPVLMVGGYVDHIHMLFKLSQKVALMEVVKKVKGGSSKWIKTQDSKFRNFYWQDGYGAFSVSPKGVDVVVAYIKNQHVHHGQQTFKEEYRVLLREYGVGYDERYVWD